MSEVSYRWHGCTLSGIATGDIKPGGLNVTTAKETMVDIISRQPDDSSYDALLKELAYARMIQRGLEDAAIGRTIADADVKNAIDSWQK
ncbi:MAG: hypothetical protein MUC43_07065 [Pirellula sp.]|nr:hypothetical protein [Pirellula sp.]